MTNPTIAGTPAPDAAAPSGRCPVTFDPHLGAYVVTGYHEVAHVLSQPSTYSSAVAIPTMAAANPPDVLAVLGPGQQGAPGVRMVVADPPRHAALKQEGRTLFGRERAERLAPDVHTLARQLLAQHADDVVVDIVTSYADPAAYWSLCRYLGIPDADRDRVRAWADGLITLINPTADHADKLAAAHERSTWFRYLDTLVAAKRQAPGEDLVSELITTGRQHLIAEYLDGALAAGIATTRDLIATCVLALLEQADRALWERAGSSVEQAALMVEEAMRWDSPHRGLARIAAHDAHLAGVEIKAGALVLPMVGDANRDPDTFADPQVFDPHRDNVRHHLALGRGVHRCLGIHLARTVASVAVHELARALPQAHLAPGFTAEYLPSPFFRGLTTLPVAW